MFFSPECSFCKRLIPWRTLARRPVTVSRRICVLWISTRIRKGLRKSLCTDILVLVYLLDARWFCLGRFAISRNVFGVAATAAWNASAGCFCWRTVFALSTQAATMLFDC